eukprot:7385024-Ditylum_brightwellii.AAC.1
MHMLHSSISIKKSTGRRHPSCNASVLERHRWNILLCMIADWDFKLIGGSIGDFLTGVLQTVKDRDEDQAFVSGAPTGRQNQKQASRNQVE